MFAMLVDLLKLSVISLIHIEIILKDKCLLPMVIRYLNQVLLDIVSLNTLEPINQLVTVTFHKFRYTVEVKYINDIATSPAYK